jgi:metallo-beta-lactamase family protein
MVEAGHVLGSASMEMRVTENGRSRIVVFSGDIGPRYETQVLFTGFQAKGSLGRQLVDGKKLVSIRGEKIPVRASIHPMGGLSGHAGQSDLLNWFDTLAPSRPQLFLTHGEDRSRSALRGLIAARHGIDARCPKLNEVIEV